MVDDFKQQELGVHPLFSDPTGQSLVEHQCLFCLVADGVIQSSLARECLWSNKDLQLDLEVGQTRQSKISKYIKQCQHRCPAT
jgi:hypothetical protein